MTSSNLKDHAHRSNLAGPSPRPHQVEALAGLAEVLATGRRAQLHAACGSGKTYVGAWAAEECGARLAIVLTPSLNLVQQAAAAWLEVHPSARLLVVCSDPTTAEGVAERGPAGDPYAKLRDPAGRAQVTTRADVIAHHLDGADERLTLVVGTYHSSPAIAAALRLSDTDVEVDLLICDEAHQLAGRVSPTFATALRDTAIPARRRIFMTATPVTFGNLADDDALDELEQLDERPLVSMDDTATFGPVAYRLSAGEAIARGLLADYRVLVVAGEPAETAELDSLHALVDAVSRHGVRRVLTFHNRVAAARRFARTVSDLGRIEGLPVLAEAVDGSMPTSAIRAALDRLGDPAAGDRITVVASARVLREGVDIPAADAVIFCDPRTSNVDIIQAIGRALRLHPGKRSGTIVIPLALRVDEDDDDQLAGSEFAHIWQVLRGLRAHDDRVGTDLDAAARRLATTPSGPVTAPAWLDVVGLDPAVLDRVLIRLVRGSSAVWEQWYALLEQEAARLGSAARVTTSHTVAGRKLGVWLSGQRWLHRRGVLRADKAARLEQLPGWSWSSTAAADERTLLTLRELAERTGSAAENPTGPSAYAGLRDGLRRPLGLVVARIRHQYAAGELDPAYAAALEALPGWTWEPLTAADRAGVDALRSFISWEKHPNVPARHVEGDVELGEWVLGVRRRHLLGTIPPALVDEVVAVSPTLNKGYSAWEWQHARTQWLLCADALVQFAARTGGTRVPVGHVEHVDGYPVSLYQWCSVQRHRHNKGELPEAQIRWLESQPGWVWRSPGMAKPAGTPLDLGGHPHGTAKGAAAKCPCGPCLEYRRGYGRRSIASHRALADAIPPGVALGALRQLDAAIAERIAGDKRFERPPGAIAIATAAGIPVAVVRSLRAGDRGPVSRAHTVALLNTTAADVLALFDTMGSRGRLVMSAEEPVDAGPTLALLEDLASRGWNQRWIARELGYGQLAVKINRRTVTRRIAEAIAELHDRVGPRVAPNAGSRRRPPPLHDVLAAERAVDAELAS